MVRALEAEAAKRGSTYRWSPTAAATSPRCRATSRTCWPSGVDGLIMNISPLEALPGPMAAIKKAGKPVVLVNRKLTGGEYDAWVGVDNLRDRRPASAR